MPTISANVSKKELDAIREYANACGETTSNLIRKSIVGEAIFINCFHDVREYEIRISIPDNITGDDEDEIIQDMINKIRKILGINEIRI